MTLERFRILHSTLIEHYQFIEAHLEGIYAAVSGKPLLRGLKDVEKDSIHRILKAIKKIESEKAIVVFTEEEYGYITQILERRNFWCHNCYYDLVFDQKTGDPKNARDIQIMRDDLHEAEGLRERLFKQYLEHANSNQNTLYSFPF